MHNAEEFPTNENEKGQISVYKLEGKSMFHCKRTVEVPNSCEKLSKGLNIKLQMHPDVDFFEKLLKDNKSQEISKILKIYPSLQEEFVNFSMNRQIS